MRKWPARSLDTTALITGDNVSGTRTGGAAAALSREWAPAAQLGAAASCRVKVASASLSW